MLGKRRLKLLPRSSPVLQGFGGKKNLSAEDAQQSSLAFNLGCQPGAAREEQRIDFLWWGGFIRRVLVQRNNLLFSFPWKQPLLP